MCSLANRNKEKMTDFQNDGHNCNSCGDTCRIGSTVDTCGNNVNTRCSYNGDIGCGKRADIAADSSFMGQERFVDNATCAGVTYGIMLREPLDRLISNTRYAWSGGWNATTGEIMDLVKPGNPVVVNSDCTNCITVERTTFSYDNMFIRTLIGETGLRLVAGDVKRHHLEEAKQRLSSYSVVMILDEFDNETAQLTQGFGWEVTSLGEANSQGEEKKPVFTDKQMETLRTANALDYELYCFGRWLAAARTKQAEEAKAAKKKHHGGKDQQTQSADDDPTPAVSDREVPAPAPIAETPGDANGLDRKKHSSPPRGDHWSISPR